MSDANNTTPPPGSTSYDEMRAAIEQHVPLEADREALIARLEHLRSVEGTDDFDSAYEHLEEGAKEHVAVLGPFLSRLSLLLGG